MTSTRPVRQGLVRVPLVTGYFWVIKILATTVGETSADYLDGHLGGGLTNTTLFMVALLIAALAVQFLQRRYTPWSYWLVVTLISVVGTLITDNLSDQLGVPLEVTTIAFGLALVVVFGRVVRQRTHAVDPHRHYRS